MGREGAGFEVTTWRITPKRGMCWDLVVVWCVGTGSYGLQYLIINFQDSCKLVDIWKLAMVRVCIAWKSANAVNQGFLWKEGEAGYTNERQQQCGSRSHLIIWLHQFSCEYPNHLWELPFPHPLVQVLSSLSPKYIFITWPLLPSFSSPFPSHLLHSDHTKNFSNLGLCILWSLLLECSSLN